MILFYNYIIKMSMNIHNVNMFILKNIKNIKNKKEKNNDIELKNIKLVHQSI